jgi:hypothetical protein
MSVQTNSTAIRRILYGNAIFSGLSGLFLAVASNQIAQFLGVDAPLAILFIGIGLAGYTILLYMKASRPEISRSFVLIAIIGDSLWVLLSIILLLTGWIPFSPEGKWAVGIVATVVDVFATLQFIEWRKM